MLLRALHRRVIVACMKPNSSLTLNLQGIDSDSSNWSDSEPKGSFSASPEAGRNVLSANRTGPPEVRESLLREQLIEKRGEEGFFCKACELLLDSVHALEDHIRAPTHMSYILVMAARKADVTGTRGGGDSQAFPLGSPGWLPSVTSEYLDRNKIGQFTGAQLDLPSTCRELSIHSGQYYCVVCVEVLANEPEIIAHCEMRGHKDRLRSSAPHKPLGFSFGAGRDESNETRVGELLAPAKSFSEAELKENGVIFVAPNLENVPECVPTEIKAGIYPHTYFCTLCWKKLYADSILAAHVESSSHQKLKNRGATQPPSSVYLARPFQTLVSQEVLSKNHIVVANGSLSNVPSGVRGACPGWFVCLVCYQACSSAASVETHIRGKNHQKNVQWAPITSADVSANRSVPLPVQQTPAPRLADDPRERAKPFNNWSAPILPGAEEEESRKEKYLRSLRETSNNVQALLKPKACAHEGQTLDEGRRDEWAALCPREEDSRAYQKHLLLTSEYQTRDVLSSQVRPAHEAQRREFLGRVFKDNCIVKLAKDRSNCPPSLKNEKGRYACVLCLYTFSSSRLVEDHISNQAHVASMKQLDYLRHQGCEIVKGKEEGSFSEAEAGGFICKPCGRVFNSVTIEFEPLISHIHSESHVRNFGRC